MKDFTPRTIVAALLILTAMPAAAQTPMAGGQFGYPAPRGQQLRDVISRLSPQGRQVFTSEWVKQTHEQKAARKAAYASAHQQIIQAMLADPFHPEALESAYGQQRKTVESFQKQRQKTMIQILTKLSASDRRIIAGQLETLWQGNNMTGTQ